MRGQISANRDEDSHKGHRKDWS